MKKIPLKTFVFLAFSSAGFSFQIIEINSASVEQIALLPGVGKGLAKKIVEYRLKRGFFRQKSELLEIPGLNQKKYDALVSKISLEVKKPKNQAENLFEQIPIPKVIDLELLEEKVLKHLNLENEKDVNLLSRVRKSALLPKISLLFDVDKKNGLSEKKSISADPSFLTKNVMEYGVGLRASFDLGNLVFNDQEIEASKLILKREEEREKIISRVQKKYFRYKRILESLKIEKNPLTLSSISLELQEIEAELNYLSNQAFTKFQGK